MPYYTGLARVARKTGYPVIEVAGWEKRGHGPMISVKTIVCHHTAGGPNGNYPSMGTVLGGRPGLPGPLSQYGLGRDGTIYVIAAGLSWHTGKARTENESNARAIGIEAENTGRGEPWSDRQLDAYVKLCRALIDEFGLTANDVKGHKEIAVPAGRKPDPSFNMDTFRSWVRAGKHPSAGRPTPVSEKITPKPTPTPAPKDEFDMATISELKAAINEAVSALRVPVTRGGKPATRDLVTVISGLDSNTITHGSRLAALESAVKVIGEKSGIDPAELAKIMQDAAKTGAAEAIAEGVEISGTATVELKKAE